MSAVYRFIRPCSTRSTRGHDGSARRDLDHRPSGLLVFVTQQGTAAALDVLPDDESVLGPVPLDLVTGLDAEFATEVRGDGRPYLLRDGG